LLVGSSASITRRRHEWDPGFATPSGVGGALERRRRRRSARRLRRACRDEQQRRHHTEHVTRAPGHPATLAAAAAVESGSPRCPSPTRRRETVARRENMGPGGHSPLGREAM
jgi:hypothetical protein